MPVVEARNLTKTYTIADREIRVLDNVSLTVTAGEFLVIEGSSGSGKTTLLSLLSQCRRLALVLDGFSSIHCQIERPLPW